MAGGNVETSITTVKRHDNARIVRMLFAPVPNKSNIVEDVQGVLDVTSTS
jgi:hypothetical protein